MTVLAVSNPSRTGVEPAALHDRAPGYGVVTLDRASRRVELACWPRRVDLTAPGARPYPGWPVRFHQLDARRARGWLPELDFVGAESPVVELYRAADDELVYAVRAEGRRFQPPVFEPDAEHYLVLRSGAERRRLPALPAAATRAAAGRFTVRF